MRREMLGRHRGDPAALAGGLAATAARHYHGRERAALHPPGGGRRSSRRGRRRKGGRARRRAWGRDHQHCAEASLLDAFDRGGGRGQAPVRPGDSLLCGVRAEGASARPRGWPNAALAGDLAQELPLPRHVEEAATMVSEEDVAETVVCGPGRRSASCRDRDVRRSRFRPCLRASGGPEQAAFIRFYESEVSPEARRGVVS